MPRGVASVGSRGLPHGGAGGRWCFPAVSVLAGLLLSACAMPPPAGAIEKGTYSQIVTRERRVTVVGLPEMGQVLERHGAKVEVLLPSDSKRTELTLWFRVAVAADDTRRFEQAVPRRAQLELRAFG